MEKITLALVDARDLVEHVVVVRVRGQHQILKVRVKDSHRRFRVGGKHLKIFF